MPNPKPPYNPTDPERARMLLYPDLYKKAGAYRESLMDDGLDVYNRDQIVITDGKGNVVRVKKYPES